MRSILCLVTLLIVLPALAEAQFINSPFDTGLTSLQSLFTGTVAKVASLIAIVIGGYGGKITLPPGQSKAEEFSTLVHELGHEMLHRAERRTLTTKTVRETEAESIAFIVGRAVGLNTGSASADYVVFAVM
jgi:hypothetical protein